VREDSLLVLLLFHLAVQFRQQFVEAVEADWVLDLQSARQVALNEVTHKQVGVYFIASACHEVDLLVHDVHIFGHPTLHLLVLR